MQKKGGSFYSREPTSLPGSIVNRSKTDTLLTLSSLLSAADEGAYVEPSPVAAAVSPPPSRPSSASGAMQPRLS